MKKIIVKLLIFLIMLLLTASCANQPVTTENTLKVGVTSGPEATIMYAVMHEAAQNGLKIEVVELDGYNTPNAALNEGKIDVNSFQNQPYLENVMQNSQYDFVPIAKTIIMPMGIYSDKVKNIQEVPDNATVLIPNDHINSGRALVLLETAGLIKLRPEISYQSTIDDIVVNPKNLIIREIDGEQISQQLKEVDLAAINTSYATKADLNPAQNSLIMENATSPYAHVLVVRSKDKNNPLLNKLIKAYHSEEVRKYIHEQFKSTIIPAW